MILTITVGPMGDVRGSHVIILVLAASHQYKLVLQTCEQS